MTDRIGPAHVTPTKADAPSPETSPLPERRESDPDDLAEDAARLRADREIRDKLAAQGFAGDAYAVFEEELAGYGHQLMAAWLASGYIFTRCRAVGLSLLAVPVPVSDHEDLAQETVAEALRSFKQKGLVEGGWRPERGASMKSYFTGALLFQFANIWRRWSRARTASSELSLDSLPADPESPNPDPADIAVQRDEILRGLMNIDNEKTRTALVLVEEGYEHEEIAEALGPDTTARAVEGLLRRHRRRVAARHDEDGAPR